MMRVLRALPLLLLLAACSAAPVSFRAPARLVAQADDLADQGQAQEASHVYERVLREHPTDPAAASSLRSYRAAHATFSRLLSEYPQSRWEREARAWRAVLTDLLAREDESARLRAQIERLRRTDLDLERRH